MRQKKKMGNIGKKGKRQNKKGAGGWRTHLAMYLKAYREDHNLIQRQLGELLYVSGEAIYKYENEKNEPKLDVVVKLAMLTGASIDEMLGLKPASTNSTNSTNPVIEEEREKDAKEPGKRPEEPARREEFLNAVWEAHRRVFGDLLRE